MIGKYLKKTLDGVSVLRLRSVSQLPGSRLIVCVVAFSLLSACAQINRYPEYPQRYTVQVPQPAAMQGAGGSSSGMGVPADRHIRDLRDAIAHAEATYVSMQRHIDSHDTLINSLAIAAHILAGGLAADALIDQSEDFTTIGVVAGLTSYAIAEWLTDPADENLYALGMTAIDCSIRAVGPLMGTEDLTQPLQELNQAIGELEAQKQALLTSREYARNEVQVRFFSVKIEAVNALLEAAGNAETRGIQLQRKVGSADQELSNLVRSVHLQVVNKLIEDAKSVGDLRSRVSSLVFKPSDFIEFSDPSDFVFGGSGEADADSLVGGLGRADPSGDGRRPSTLRPFDEGKFNEAFGRVKAATGLVQKIVESVDYTDVEDGLNQCGIDVPKTTSSLKLEPKNVVVRAGQELPPVEFSIKGGSGKYTAFFSPAIPGLSVMPNAGFGPSFTVSASSKVKPGTYKLKVEDSVDKIFTLFVLVQAPKDKGNVAPSSNVCSGSGVGTRLVQKNLLEFGFKPGPVDCVCGEKTKAAIRSFLSAGGALMVPAGTTASCASLSSIKSSLAIANALIKDPAARTPLGIKTLALEDLLRQKLGDAAVRPDGVLDLEERRLIVGCTFSLVPTEAELNVAIDTVRSPAFRGTEQ